MEECDTVNPVPLLTRLVSPRSPEASDLLLSLTAEIAAMYADRDDDGGAGFALEDAEGPRAAFIVAWLDGRPVGCGALRHYDDERGEIKRMFVVSDARGRGVARAILEALEAEAVRLGYTRMLLETGDRQPDAVRLYERAGYVRTAQFGVYVEWIGSLCFAKDLAR
jgi:GNAT superfamily N-acetyltransferase